MTVVIRSYASRTQGMDPLLCTAPGRRAGRRRRVGHVTADQVYVGPRLVDVDVDPLPAPPGQRDDPLLQECEMAIERAVPLEMWKRLGTHVRAEPSA
ncbi:hypothetical protein [Virgisporangium aurantiacum]|uniref:hypothetical protein n=1 Tax=Virgisporangium aurantiacum TaxID=175570 RepID=UPI001951E0FB|nr:hypothetical protein [Virgisporangium aurantiacum]